MDQVVRKLLEFLDTEDLKRSIKAAHLKTTSRNYLYFILLCTFLSTTVLVMVLSTLYLLDIQVSIIPVLSSDIALPLISVIIIAVLFLMMYIYPGLVAQGRKTAIEIDLPYAITYMQAMSQTVTLYNNFRNIYLNDDLYGEVSKELGMIVRDVEIFGDDLLTAMRNLQLYTPSESMRDLLNDLATVFQSGGSLSSFFASRSAHYRERAKQEMENTLKTMEIMAEVYVTAFVAGPIAFMIMMVAENLSGQSSIGELLPLMYIFLPIGAIVMVVILQLIMPPDTLKVSKKVTPGTEFDDYHQKIDRKSSIEDDFIKKLAQTKKSIRIKSVLKNPLRHYISSYDYSIVLACPLALTVAALYFLGSFSIFFPDFTLEIFISAMIIAFCLPIAIAYEGRNIYKNKVEKDLPDLLREISDMKDMGMTLQSAISMIAKSKMGVLTSELTYVTKEIEMGVSINNALVRMEERIGLVSVKRAISLIIKASEITDYLQEILAIAIGDLQHYLKMKSERFGVSFVYLAIIYLSFGIYLYSGFQLNDAFVASFKEFNISFDTISTITTMFHISLILGFFSGLMAGQLSGNNILSGFKHAIIFTVASVVLFVYIL